MRKLKNLEKPIIFIGTGRSGTTIISEIISRHPDLAFPSNYNELLPGSKYINLMRRVFDNRFWRAIGQKKQLNKTSVFNKYIFKSSEGYRMWDYLTGKDIDFSRGFLLDEPLTEQRINFIRDYFDAMVKYQNRSRLTFKITGPSRMAFLLKIFPDAMFINLKRNLIPTISSFIKVEFWQTKGMDKLWWVGAYDEEEQEWVTKNADNSALLTAFQLNKVRTVTEEERKLLKPNFLEVSYEDFVENPEKEIDRILDFTQLQPSESMQNYLQDIKIVNRNKKDLDYFEEKELKMIYQIIESN